MDKFTCIVNKHDHTPEGNARAAAGPQAAGVCTGEPDLRQAVIVVYPPRAFREVCPRLPAMTRLM